MVEPRRVTLGVEHHNWLAVVVEVGHMVDLEEGHHTAAMSIGLGEEVLRKMAVGEEDSHAAVGLGYGEERHMVAAGMECILVVGDMDCVKALRMVVVAVVGSPGCTGLGVYTLHVPHYGLPAHILEVGGGHHSPAEVDSHVVDSPEEDFDSADILLSKSQLRTTHRNWYAYVEEEHHTAVDNHLEVEGRTWLGVNVPGTMKNEARRMLKR